MLSSGSAQAAALAAQAALPMHNTAALAVSAGSGHAAEPPAQFAGATAAPAVSADEPEVSILSAQPNGEGADTQPNAASDKPLLTFPVLSDIHVQDNDPVSQAKFKAAMRDLGEVNPNADALIINGDLTGGLPEDYTKLRQLMGELPHPDKVFYTIGNHEFYKAWYDADRKWSPATFPNGETEQASIDRFLQFTQQPGIYHDQMIKGHQFIFLGSERYRISDPSNNEDAYLSPNQLSWLKQALAKSKDSSKPIFVFLHQPLPNTVAGTNYWAYMRAVVQHEQLREILSDYPQVILFSGHTHWDLKLPKTFVQDKFTSVNSSSVYGPLTDDGTGLETTVPAENSEGLYVEVYADRVVIKGRDFHRKQWIPDTEFSVKLGDSGK
ncbi:metallophosphoesterase [Paenibacillus xerothermodurans]|uniref:Metallophosphoesterase n=2 Tax=Paenibacillus xerothermodurans TaxID=1977292 RepID=A0A2W1NPR9_PAEXE|nr:metallophosphoesterase [Paenibacillus xerothermodurans]